ncbi:unnamed protein product [Caenorhabditis nigoni]
MRFFEYFHTRRKTQKMKEAKSRDTSEDPSEAVKSPELKDPGQPVSTQDYQAPSTRPDDFELMRDTAEKVQECQVSQDQAVEARNSPLMDRLTSWEDAQFHPEILENLRAIKFWRDTTSATETEVTEPLLHEFRRDIKQEIEDLASSVPVTEEVHSQQSHGAQNLEDLLDDERFEMEGRKTILSHGSLLHLGLTSPHHLQKLLKQTQETLATCHVNVAEKQSGKIDYTRSPMAQAPRISGPAQYYQADISQQDARSQERLLEELSRQVTAIQSLGIVEEQCTLH